MELNLRWRAAFAKVLIDSALEVSLDEAQTVAENWFRSCALLDPEEAAWLYIVNRAGEHLGALSE